MQPVPDANRQQNQAGLWLWGVSIGYLSLPLLIFALSWLRMPWAMLFTLLWLAGFSSALHDTARDAQIRQAMAAWFGSIKRRQLWMMALGCLFLVAISGVGGYGYQGRDWEKHGLILKDLVQYPWPVTYNYYGEQVGLVYYLAYYLPAALVGKLSNIWLAHHALALWTLAGLLLSVLWFALLTKRAPHYALLIFTLFSGLSAVGVLLRFYPGLTIFAGTDSSPWFFGDSLLDSWSRAWHYLSMLTGLLWAPQHALASWIITGMLLFVSFTSAGRKNTLFLAGLSGLWSPFITLGLTPFFLADLVARQQMSFVARLQRYVSIPNMSGLAILCLTGVYYATKLKPIAVLMNTGFGGGTVLAELNSWDSPAQFVATYLLFCLLSFGVYFLLDRYQSFAGLPTLKSTYLLVFIWLAGLPFFSFGKFNDLVMRSSMPALFFVALIVGRNGYLLQAAMRRKVLWLLVILLAALNPLTMIGFHVQQIVQRGAWYELDINSERNLAEQYATDGTLMQQYVSNIETPFFWYLAKQRAPALDQPARAAILFGAGIVLVNAHLNQQQASPGDQLEMQLEFRAIEPVAKNYTVAVQLVDAQGKTLWVEQNWPAGAPTSTWTKERRLWYDSHSPVIPVDAVSQLYRLEVYLTDPDTQAKLPAANMASGASLGEIVPIAYVQVGADQPTPQQPLPAPPQFGEQIALLGSNLPAQAALIPGQSLAVDLVWQALDWPKLDYTGFVQLLDPQGRLVAQHDQPLTQGFIPPTLWQPGLRIADHYQLSIPAELQPGVYHLIVGLYDGATVTRLPVRVAGSAAGDAFSLSELSSAVD